MSDIDGLIEEHFGTDKTITKAQKRKIKRLAGEFFFEEAYDLLDWMRKQPDWLLKSENEAILTQYVESQTE